MLVFVPVSRAELGRWAGEGTHLAGQAFAATTSMRRAFGFDPGDDEEAEHTALHVAGLVALLRTGVRLVAVADAAATAGDDADFGEVVSAAMPWPAVTALFAESDPAAARSLHEQLDGVGLAAAWDDDRVQAFLTDHELLWHGPGEVSALT